VFAQSDVQGTAFLKGLILLLLLLNNGNSVFSVRAQLNLRNVTQRHGDQWARWGHLSGFMRD
jgi:hypothetical protein